MVQLEANALDSMGLPRSRAGYASAQMTRHEKLGLYKGAEPTRSWKPGKVWVARDGIFPKSAKCLNTYAPFESSLEALAHLHLSVDPRIQSYVCQPAPLHYWMPNAEGGKDKREYTPDFVALTKDERLLVIDAKAERFAKDEKWTRREPLIREAYRVDHAAELIVWTERELQREPRLSNARMLYRHRFAPANRHLEFALLRHLAAHSANATIGDICDEVSRELNCNGAEVFGTIMRLALEGQVSLGSGSKYDRTTEIHLRGQAE